MHNALKQGKDIIGIILMVISTCVLKDWHFPRIGVLDAWKQWWIGNYVWGNSTIEDVGFKGFRVFGCHTTVRTPTFHQSPLTRPVVIISYSLCLGRKNTLPSTSTIRWKTERESTPKRLIYSTSRSGTTFQVGIQSSNSLIKSTQKLLVPASTSTSKSSTLIRCQIPTSLRPTFTEEEQHAWMWPDKN